MKGFYRKMSKFLGCYIGREVTIGNNVIFVHNSIGTVIHSDTVIGNNVRIYSGVTLGQKNIYEAEEKIKFVIEDNVTLCSGCKVLSENGTLTIGKGSIVAANAVLTHSIPPFEVWGGVPAKKLGNVNVKEKRYEFF